MQIGQLSIRDETAEDGALLGLDLVQGLPEFAGDGDFDGGGFIVSLHGLKLPYVGFTLPDGRVFSLLIDINGRPIQIANFYCVKLLSIKNDVHRYLMQIGRTSLPKLRIFEAWADGDALSWQDLDVRYSDFWIDACMDLANPSDWVQECVVSGEIHLNSDGLRSESDFYCLLGEKIFGYRGYAGSNLAALFDVLMVNKVKKKFLFEDEGKFSNFLSMISGEADYFSRFKSVLLDSGSSFAEGA
ncbi:hypothetical protein ACTJLF_25965 [Variovorax sp. 22077]